MSMGNDNVDKLDVDVQRIPFDSELTGFTVSCENCHKQTHIVREVHYNEATDTWAITFANGETLPVKLAKT